MRFHIECWEDNGSHFCKLTDYKGIQASGKTRDDAIDNALAKAARYTEIETKWEKYRKPIMVTVGLILSGAGGLWWLL